MRSRGAHLTIVLFLCVLPTACSSKRGPDEKLAAHLDPVLHSLDDTGSIFAARVVELPSGRELYAHRADEPMIPASNGKLANSAAALDRFGPDYKFKTYLAIDGAESDDMLAYTKRRESSLSNP